MKNSRGSSEFLSIPLEEARSNQAAPPTFGGTNPIPAPVQIVSSTVPAPQGIDLTRAFDMSKDSFNVLQRANYWETRPEPPAAASPEPRSGDVISSKSCSNCFIL